MVSQSRDHIEVTTNAALISSADYAKMKRYCKVDPPDNGHSVTGCPGLCRPKRFILLIINKFNSTVLNSCYISVHTLQSV